MAPFKNIFSRAVNSGSKPAPNSIIGDITPFTVTVPFVGFMTPETTFNSVDFPAPLLPIRPITSPFFTSKDISCKAQKSLFIFFLFFFENKFIKVSLNDVASIPKLNFIDTFFNFIILTSYIKYNI